MTAELIKTFLMWSSIINVALILFWGLLIILTPETVYKMQVQFFPIKREQFDVVIYCFIGIYKLLIIFFNIIPWIVLEIIA
jgi:hypothetical protein